MWLERRLWIKLVPDEEDVRDAEVGGGFGGRDCRMPRDAVLVLRSRVRAGGVAPEPEVVAEGAGHARNLTTRRAAAPGKLAADGKSCKRFWAFAAHRERRAKITWRAVRNSAIMSLVLTELTATE